MYIYPPECIFPFSKLIRRLQYVFAFPKKVQRALKWSHLAQNVSSFHLLKDDFFPSLFCVLLFMMCTCTKLVLMDPNVVLVICLLFPFCQCPVFPRKLFIVFMEVSTVQNASKRIQHLNNHLANPIHEIFKRSSQA